MEVDGEIHSGGPNPLSVSKGMFATRLQVLASDIFYLSELPALSLLRGFPFSAGLGSQPCPHGHSEGGFEHLLNQSLGRTKRKGRLMAEWQTGSSFVCSNEP